MALDPTPVYRSIEAKVREVAGKTPVYVAEIPPDDQLPMDSHGTMLPFIVLYFGGPIRSVRDRNLVSTRRDVNILYLTVEVFAPMPEISQQIKGRIIDGITGFQEGDMSELTLSGLSLSSTRASNTVRPTQYIDMQSWQCMSNLSV